MFVYWGPSSNSYLCGDIFKHSTSCFWPCILDILEKCQGLEFGSWLLPWQQPWEAFPHLTFIIYDFLTLTSCFHSPWSVGARNNEYWISACDHKCSQKLQPNMNCLRKLRKHSHNFWISPIFNHQLFLISRYKLIWNHHLSATPNSNDRNFLPKNPSPPHLGPKSTAATCSHGLKDSLFHINPWGNVE